jgi:hypothetical protein
MKCRPPQAGLVASFSGEMHALMPSVLLGENGEDPFAANVRSIPQAAACIGVGGLCEAVELPIAGSRRM